jgi:hypothetical protein
VRGEDLVGLEYEGPFDHFAAQDGVVHRVIPWDEVSLDEGTGIVHIAPGAGAEDFELSRVHDLPVLTPIDESGRMLPGYGELEGKTTEEVVDPVIESLRERNLLVEATSIVHRYPVCWRCRTPLVFRVVDDWFISAAEIRQPMLDGNATVEWTPPQYKKRMDDWLRNMGDWNISRRRFFGLPLPFYECGVREVERDRVARAARGAGRIGARPARGAASALDRRRPDPLRGLRRRGRAHPGGRGRVARRRHRPLLDSGLAQPGMDPGRLRDRRLARALRRRPSRPRVLGEVVPGRLGLGGTRADPALVLLPVLHGDRPRRP